MSYDHWSIHCRLLTWSVVTFQKSGIQCSSLDFGWLHTLAFSHLERRWLGFFMLLKNFLCWEEALWQNCPLCLLRGYIAYLEFQNICKMVLSLIRLLEESLVCVCGGVQELFSVLGVHLGHTQETSWLLEEPGFSCLYFGNKLEWSVIFFMGTEKPQVCVFDFYWQFLRDKTKQCILHTKHTALYSHQN